MSGNPVYDAIRRYVRWVSENVGAQPDSDEPVAVHYSHPGDRHDDTVLVWVENIRWTTEIHSLRANVRRRLVEVRFDLVVGAQLEGNPDGDLQYRCDMVTQEVIDTVDLDIATEEHLHSPETVDVAWVDGVEVERGMTATGVGARSTLTVGFRARYID